MIDFYTFYLGGRPKYINQTIQAIDKLKQYGTTHHIILQGCNLENEVYNLIDENTSHILFHLWDENIGVASGINKVKCHFNHKYCMKIDDDCKIYEPESFMEHLIELSKLMPDAVISPYPVGLINNPGGVHTSPKQHAVIYGKDTDTYYTIRKVPHVGGFARFSKTEYIQNCNFIADLSETSSGNEDGQFSSYCNNNNISMFYLENAIVVEHMESTLGQHERYGKGYFKNRF